MNIFKCFFFISLCLSTMVVHANKLSISGKPQDEAHCAMLSSPHVRNNDKRCKKTEIKKVEEWYEFNRGLSMWRPNVKTEDLAAECKNISVAGKNSDSDVIVSIANQIDLARKNNLEVLIDLVENTCIIKFKTNQKSAICSNEWNLASRIQIFKVEVMTGNVPSRKVLDWKSYCS